MQVQIGKCSDDPRKLHKIFTALHTLDVDVHEPTDIMNPTLILTYQTDLTDCNYMYIPAWGRYYYVTEVLAITGTRMQIEGRADVLMSFQEDIENVTCVMDRTTWDCKNLYITDRNSVIYQFTQTYHHQFSYTFNPFGHIYLSTIG